MKKALVVFLVSLALVVAFIAGRAAGIAAAVYGLEIVDFQQDNGAGVAVIAIDGAAHEYGFYTD